jgi:D-alanyl-D-alanine carboxypeptidase (penicillin-binding protein 5/6)
VADYRADLVSGQSVVQVDAGEHITEREALEGMLVPSGNNIATLLARWDAGGESAFLVKMNAQARALGLAHTRYTSASGVKSSTVSTARDQVILAMRALTVPALAQTVAMRQAPLPVAGLQYNRDTLLGTNGIVGVKPGTTAAAGGCFVFAARSHLAGRTVTVVGAVLGQAVGQDQPTMEAAAAQATMTLLDSTRRELTVRRVLGRGTTLAWINAPWGVRAAARTVADVSLVGWPGMRTQTEISMPRHVATPVAAAQHVGAAVVSAGVQRATVGLAASRAIPDPSLGWRLVHP